MSGVVNFNGTSVACQTAATNFVNCATQNSQQMYDEKTCSACSSQYNSIGNACNDGDYKASKDLVFYTLSCHQESGKFCVTNPQSTSYNCNDCGKWVAKRIMTYGLLDQDSDAGERNQIQACASSKKKRSFTFSSNSFLFEN